MSKELLIANRPCSLISWKMHKYHVTNHGTKFSPNDLIIQWIILESYMIFCIHMLMLMASIQTLENTVKQLDKDLTLIPIALKTSSLIH